MNTKSNGALNSRLKYWPTLKQTGANLLVDADFELNTGELDEILKKLPGELKRKVTRNAVSAGARVIRDAAKTLAPYDKSRTSGVHLRDAIVSKRKKGTNDIFKIGVISGPKGAPHGHLVEFGTVNQLGQPFLRPAAKQTAPEVAGRIIRNMVNGINRESKKLAGKGKRKK